MDDEDYDRLIAFKWHAQSPNGKRFYGARSTKTPKATIYLHQAVMGTEQIRSGNGDMLDCQKSNLIMFGKHIRTWDESKGESAENLLCRKCNELKPLSEFHQDRKKSRQYGIYCKPCARVGIKKWTSLNIERVRERGRNHHQKNPWSGAWENAAVRATKKGLGIMSRVEFYAWYKNHPRCCEYCGMTEQASKAMFRELLSIDRKDPSNGYISGNIAMACRRCNNVKSSHLSYEQMMVVAAMFFRPKVTV